MKWCFLNKMNAVVDRAPVISMIFQREQKSSKLQEHVTQDLLKGKRMQKTRREHTKCTVISDGTIRARNFRWEVWSNDWGQLQKGNYLYSIWPILLKFLRFVTREASSLYTFDARTASNDDSWILGVLRTFQDTLRTDKALYETAEVHVCTRRAIRKKDEEKAKEKKE